MEGVIIMNFEGSSRYVLDEELKILKTFTEQEVIEGMLKNDCDITFEEFIARKNLEKTCQSYVK